MLIVNPQDNTRLRHYVISVRKTSVVGNNKRELKVMKPFKQTVAQHYFTKILFSAQTLSGFSCDQRNF